MCRYKRPWFPSFVKVVARIVPNIDGDSALSTVQWKEAPGDKIPEPLAMRVAGGIRTHNHPLSHKGALSVELQPHARED